MSKFSKKLSSGDSLSRSSRSLRTVNGYRRHVGKVPSLQNILKVIGTLSTPVYNSADSRGRPAMEMTVHPPSRLSHRSSASSNASQSQRSSHKGDYYRHQDYHHHGNHQLSRLQGNDVTNPQDFQTSMEYQKYCDVPTQSAAKHQHHVRQATTIAQWVAAASNNKEKLLDRQSEITRRQDGLPSALTPDSKTSRSSPNNYTSNILAYNCTSNNINNNNKNIKNDNNNSNSSHSTRSNNSSHSNSHSKNVNKNNSSNVNSKSNKVNNTGITAVDTGNTNASGNTKKQDSPFISNKSEVKHSVGSVANDGDMGGGNGASEDWPCPTPYPTRCPSLEEENTYEFHQASINAALNSAMNVAKDGTRHASCLSEIRAEETEEKLKEEITAEAIKISNEVKSLIWNDNSEMTNPESQGEINKTIGIVASKTEQKLLKEDSVLKRKDMKLPKEINELSQSEKPTSKEHTQVKHTTPLALTKFHKEETRKPKMKDIKEEDRENKTVPQETEVKAKERELIKLKEKEGKTNIISIPTRDRLPRVAVSLRDGPKSQFLKIHQWHINKDGHLTLGCCLPLGDNQNGIKMEVSETPSSKDAVKCDTVPAATDSNESVCPVVPRMLKNGCIEPTVLAPPLAIYTVNSEQTYAPPTDLQYSAAQATTKMTLEGSQLPGAAVDATSLMTSTPLGVTLTFASSNSKDGGLTASPTLIPIPISMLMTNHTPTMVPLNKIASEKPYDCDKDPGLHCLWRNPTSLEDLLAVLRSTCAPSAEGSPSCESVYAHRPRKKPVALRSRTGTRRRESCWRRPCSVLRALATALRLHKPPICADCALSHGGVGASDAFEDGSGSEDERQPAANTGAPRNTHNVAVYQTSQNRYEWGEKETEGSEDETGNKPSAGRSRSSTAPPRKNAILVDTGCDPRSADAHSRTPPTPSPSPAEVPPRTCPDAAIGTGKTRDWLDESAKNVASRDKINQSSVESIKREPSNTCNIVKNLRIKESPTPLPVGIELSQPHKTVTKTKKIQSATAPECPYCSRNAPTNCAMCQRASTLSWGKGSCTLCNKAASKSSTGIIRKPSTVTASRTAPPSTAERRGDKGRAAPVRSKPVPAKAVRHSARTHKRRAPKSRDRNRSTSRSMPAKHRSVSGRQRAKRRSISRSHQRKQRSQSNSHRGKPRSTSQSFREKQIVPSASNRNRIRSLSQPQHRELHSTPDPHRARSHSMSRLKRANQHSTTSSLHKLNRSRSQSQNRKRRSTSKSRGVPHRSLWKTDRAHPSGSSRRPTTRVRAGTRRKQLNTAPHRRKAGQRVVSTRRGNSQTLGYSKGLRRPHGVRVTQKRLAHHEDSATSLSSGSSVTSGSSSSSGSTRWSASASSTDSRVGALTAYCQTRDPTYIRECILRHLLKDRAKKFALTGPKATAPTASRSRVRMMKKGSK